MARKKSTAKKESTASKRSTKKAAVRKKATNRSKPSPKKKSATTKKIEGDPIDHVAASSHANEETSLFTHVDYSEVGARLKASSAEISKHRMIVQQVFDSYHDELFSHPDVCGLHVGLKRSQGKVSHPLRYCIRIHVRQKLQNGHPLLDSPIDLQRFKDEGVEVDVVERSYRPAAALSPPYPGPMIGGRPISKINVEPEPWGTMGMIVFTLDGQPRYLTNKHVAGDAGSVIQESNNKNSRTASGQTGIIGEVESSVRNSKVDCAIIKPVPGRMMSQGIMKPGEKNGLLPPNRYAVRRLTALDEHVTQVFKIGASTGFQPLLIGVVKNVNTSIEISGLKMVGQILIESVNGDEIIHGGDSGAIAIVKGQDVTGPVNFVVGLVHGETVEADNTETGQALVANHFDEVQSALRITLFQG